MPEKERGEVEDDGLSGVAVGVTSLEQDRRRTTLDGCKPN